MRCTKCNAPLQDIARFCSICGTPVAPPEVDHIVEGSSIPSQVDNDDISLPPVEPAQPIALERSQESEGPEESAEPIESTKLAPPALAEPVPQEQQPPALAEPVPQEQQPPALPATAEAHMGEDLTESEPTQIIPVSEQQQRSLLATIETPLPDTIEIADKPTRTIVASPIPSRPQPSRSPRDTAASYQLPEAQTHTSLSQHESIAPALPISLRQTGDPAATNAPTSPEAPSRRPFLSPNTPLPSLPYFRLDTSNKVRYMLPAVVHPQTSVVRRRKRGGLGCLLTLLVLVVIIAGGWTFVLRPFLHNLAVSQLNQALSAAVNQIPAGGAAALPSSSLKISETVINNLIVLNTSPSSPIQQPATHITPANIEIDFQLYGQPCSITSVPVVQNNQLVTTNTTDSGIISLVLSPDDITSIVNQHLAAAQNRLGRSVKSVQLQQHEVDLTLG
jgi:hypothetical protein